MYWPDTNTGVDIEPARKPVASAVRKFFTEGGAGQSPTVPGGDWFNQITNELLNVLAAAGIDPSKADDDQLLQAIRSISKVAIANDALRRSYVGAGFPPAVGSFATGGTVYTAGQVLLFEADGKGYAWEGALPKTVPAGSTPASTGGVAPGAWVDKSDSYYTVTVEQFGAVGKGGKIDTLAIQMAIDYVYTVLGGGAVLLGPKFYKVAQSALNEIYDNDGVPINASECCLVLRKGVSLIGIPGKTKVWTDNPALHLIALVANDGNTLSGFELYNTWVAGGPGAGHGILQFGTQGGVDRSCKNTVFEDLYVHNVASYCIGISNGVPENVHFNRIRTKDNGADGLDLKSRGDQSIIPAGNSATNIRVINHGGRVTGSAGIDVRGVWHLSKIVVTDFGGNAALDYAGIRFRTKPPITDPYQIVAERSTLTGFTVAATPGAAMLSSTGVHSGSDDVHISDGTVKSVGEGVVIAGNANGNANRCSVSGVTATACTICGFRSAISSDITQFTNCTDDGSPVGFRVEGTNTSLSNCNGSLSVSAGAAPTFLQSSSMMGGGGVSLERVSASAVAVLAKGTSTDIALRLVPKGASQIAAHANIYPDVANTKTLGSSGLPWAGGFTQTAFTVTSDERLKVNIASILNSEDEDAKAEFMAMRAAWRELDLFMYQFTDRVEKKRAEGKEARWHFGIVAQRAIAAFVNHGLDWTKYSIFNYDKWDSSPAETNIIPAVLDEEGNEVEPERVEVLSPAIEAGDKYTINYEEALILAEAVRREDQANQDAFNQTTLERLTLLEAQLNVGN
ncbi:tail fiber/spike domain-containing protein [Aeromonas taiwanensis]